MKNLVLYHDDLDGFCAAWVAHQTLGDAADYRPVQYGQPVPEDALDGRPVTILDFSYPRADMVRLSEASSRLLCLDHHASAVDACRGIHGCHVDEVNTRSGCVMTWEWYHPPTVPVPALCRAVDDRDRWVLELPWTREICAALESYPRSFEVWDKFAARPRVDWITEGVAILRYMTQQAAKQAARAVEVEFAGATIPTLNATMLISEIGQRLSRDHQFSATWFRRADGKYVVSLRSQDDGADVSLIAQANGGGGHKHAAGFTCGVLPWGVGS